MTVPYTHEMHARACGDAARRGVVLSRKCVQVRRRNITYCARIVEAVTLDQAGDCWTVDAVWPEEARMTVLVRNVRDCEGSDGHCICSEVETFANGARYGVPLQVNVAAEVRDIDQTGRQL